MKKLWAEFKDFMNQGDFVTIAVGLIIALQRSTSSTPSSLASSTRSSSAIVGKNSFNSSGSTSVTPASASAW